jgi:hypothetical protein
MEEKNKHSGNIDGNENNLPEKPMEESLKKHSETENNETVLPEPSQKVEKAPVKKRKIGKRIFWAVLLLILAYAGYTLAGVFLTSDNAIKQIYLVPADASIIIQSSDPLNDWKKFAGSKPWDSLKKSETFAAIAKGVESLDSMLNANKRMISLVGKRDLTISIHKIKSDDWNFLIIADLKKVSKVKLLINQAEQLFKIAGYKVTHREFRGAEILELYDPAAKDILYLSFIGNHVAASYTGKLIEASITELENPLIGRELSFLEAERTTSDRGLCKLFINYKHLPDLLGMYLSEESTFLPLLSNSMDFAGLSFDADDKKLVLSGNTFLNDMPNPFVSALLSSGKKKMKAHEILSARTAFYTNISFDSAADFVKCLEEALEQNDKPAYDSYKKSYARLETFFGIDLQKVFLNWMSGEFALAQLEPGLLGRQPELILCVHVRNMTAAKANMDYLGERIRKRVPLRISKSYYKDYEINYIELGGFFRLFFGKMFDNFEKPFYTYIGDYVVFSNKSESLLSFIEDYEQDNLLKNDEAFAKALSSVNGTSSYFVYGDMHEFFPLLRPMLASKSWIELQKNKETLYSFPQWVFQLTGEKKQIGMQLVLEHEAYAPPAVEEEIISEIIMEEEHEAATEKELMSELKRFHVEHFEGNIFREFYESGNLRSESEVKEGKRNGKYREYYENGALKLRGQYIDNQKRGTWRYYTEDGKFDGREKFKL